MREWVFCVEGFVSSAKETGTKRSCRRSFFYFEIGYYCVSSSHVAPTELGTSAYVHSLLINDDSFIITAIVVIIIIIIATLSRAHRDMRIVAHVS